MSEAQFQRTLTDIRQELDDLEAGYKMAAARQWERPPYARTTSTEVHRRGGHSDPTGDTATDSSRLRVSDSVKKAESVIEDVYRRLRAMRVQVKKAVSIYDDIDG